MAVTRVYQEEFSVIVQETSGDDTSVKVIGRTDVRFDPGLTETDNITITDVLNNRSWSFTLSELRNRTDGTYATKALARQYLSGFIGGFSNGGSGGNGTAGYRRFNSISIRDAYYNSPDPHLDELIENVTIILVNIGTTQDPDYEQQEWSGETNPSTYDATDWVVIGNYPDTPEEIKSLLAEDLTPGTLPQVTGNSIADSALMQMSDRVRSIMEIEVPASRGIMLGNLELNNGAFTIELKELASNRTFYPVGTELENSGSTKPFYFKRGSVQDFPSQANKSINITGTSIQYAVINPATSVSNRVTLDSNITTEDVNFQVRIGSHTNEPPIFDYSQSTGENLFDLSVGENNIDLPVGILVEENVTLFVTISSVNNLSLKGQSLTVTGQGTQNVPYSAFRGRLATKTTIAEENDIVSQNPYVALNARNGTIRTLNAGDLVFVLGSGEYMDGVDIDNFQSDILDLELPEGILIKDVASNTTVDGAILRFGAVQIVQTGLNHNNGSQTRLFLERYEHQQSPAQYRWRFTTTETEETFFIGHLVFQEPTPANTYWAFVDFSYLRADEIAQNREGLTFSTNGTSLSGGNKVKDVNFVGDHHKASVDANGTLNYEVDPGALSLTASNTNFSAGSGAELNADTNGNEVAVDISGANGVAPTMWASGSILDGDSGFFVMEGSINNVRNINITGSTRLQQPTTAGDELFWDLERELFTLDRQSGTYARCGAVKSSSYILSQSTFWSESGLKANTGISSANGANGARNQTLVIGTNASSITYNFQIPNLNLNQEYTTPFLVGDQITFVNPSNSNITWDIVQQVGGTMQDISGNTITSNTIAPGNSFVVQRISGNIWRIVAENDSIVQSNIVVSQELFQQDRITLVTDTSDNADNAIEGLISGGETSTASASQVSISAITARSDDNTTTMTSNAVNINMPADLDTGSEASNTWYYIWMFANPTNGQTQFKFSTSNNNPLQPAGFTKKRLIGCVYNNGSSNFRQFTTHGFGRHKQYVYDVEFLSISNATYTTTRTLVALTSTVPQLPNGYPLADITIEYSSGILLIYNDNQTSTRFFGPSGAGVVTLNDLVLTSSAQFGIAGGGGSNVTGVYLKVQSFQLEI